VAPNAWWSRPGGTSKVLTVNPEGSNSSQNLGQSAIILLPEELESTLIANRKQAYGKTFSLIEKVYNRRKRTNNNRGTASHLAPTGHIRAKLKRGLNAATTRALGKNIIPTPVNLDGLRRSPRIFSILDGHRAKTHSTSSSRLRCSPPLQGLSEGNPFHLFPGPVKFPSLADLEKSTCPYPHIDLVALQEKVILCGVPPEEVSQQLLHRTRDPSALGRSSSQNLDKEDEDNAEYPQA
jgi:hypothetical protein